MKHMETATNKIQRNPASFRDPSGFVFEDTDWVYRVIMPAYQENWLALKKAGFFSENAPEYQELPKESWFEAVPPNAIAVLKSKRLPFISYPYEWSFSQLKEAALLTLELQLKALGHGFILKDASAYNIQFFQGKPIFIDLLSFEKLRPNRPWDAYAQFCQHFLAPLALMSYRDERLNLFSRQWVDGVPLDLASRLLPANSRFSPGLLLHVHMHARMRKKYSATGKGGLKKENAALSARQLQDVTESLKRTVESIKPSKRVTEWADYYSDTNYSEQAARAKEEIVAAIAREHEGKIALDLGANDGKYSRIMAPFFEQVIAADIDHCAVDSHWRKKRHSNILPLIIDLANASPALGWHCEERQSFFERCSADFVSALALIHHLRITAGIPVEKIAEGVANLVKTGGCLLLEFVPRSDSQAQRLLSHMDDIFNDYNKDCLIAAFNKAGMSLEKEFPLPESVRILMVFKKTDSHLICK